MQGDTYVLREKVKDKLLDYLDKYHLDNMASRFIVYAVENALNAGIGTGTNTVMLKDGKLAVICFDFDFFKNVNYCSISMKKQMKYGGIDLYRLITMSKKEFVIQLDDFYVK